MRKQPFLWVAFLLLLSQGAFAKDKKAALPAYVLQAHTVAVVIDPEAGISIEDPQANRIAQRDVETALADWGRFQSLPGTQGADLIIVVRRGHDRLVDQTMSDPRANNRPGSINQGDSTTTIGAQHGQQPGLTDASGANPAGTGAHPQTEIGYQQESFVVYQGNVSNPLDGNPAWRYMGKGALQAPSVTAVSEFRKAIAEAEKQAAKRP